MGIKVLIKATIEAIIGDKVHVEHFAGLSKAQAQHGEASRPS